MSCSIHATSFWPNGSGLLSSDLVLFGTRCSVAEESSADDVFAEMSELSAGSVASSSVESCPAVDSECDVASGLRVAVKGLETADRLLSDVERDWGEDCG